MRGHFRVSTCLSHDIKESTTIRQEVRLSAQQVSTVWTTGRHTIKQRRAADLWALWQCSPVVLKRVIRDFISDHKQQKLTLFLTRANVNLETKRKKNVTENILIKYSVQITPRRKDLHRKLILPHYAKIFTMSYRSQKFINICRCIIPVMLLEIREGVGYVKTQMSCILFIMLTTCFDHCGPSSGHKNVYRGKLYRVWS